MTSRTLCTFAVLMSLLIPGTTGAIPISSGDLWDLSQGSTVDNSTGALYYSSSYRSDVRNMFGGSFGTIGIGVTLFKDYNSPGYAGGSVAPGFVHAVEWHTPAVITLRSFSLHAYNEGMLRRAFNRFTLLASNTSGGSWSTVYDTGAGFTYGQLDLSVNVLATNAQYFRAEFTQAPWNDPRAVGPRVLELDGYDTFIAGLPQPASAPGTCALLALGLLGAGFARKRRKH